MSSLLLLPVLFLCFLLALPPPLATLSPPNFHRSDGPQIIRQAFDRPVPLPNTKHLTALPASPFKIALFSDLHFGENAWSGWGPRQDVNSLHVMSVVLDRELPDFVVYLGDVVTANNVPVANASSYWDQALSPTRSRGIPFASVFGNHDDAAFQWPMEWFSSPGIPPVQCPASSSPTPVEEECSFKGTARLQLMKAEMEQNKLSYSTSGPKDLWPSISNFVLPISLYNSSQSSIAYLYFLDSGGGSYPEVISKAQVEWFRSKSQEINPDSSVPELVFWHIPSKAYAAVAPWWAIWNPCVGSINKEKVTPQQSEEGMMELLEKRPSVKAIFVGHDHGLDWCCPYKKVWLCYARHTGYGGYGNWARGSRIIEINQELFGIKSWIHMENGDVHSEVVLSG